MALATYHIPNLMSYFIASFIRSFVHSFNKYLLSTKNVPEQYWALEMLKNWKTEAKSHCEQGHGPYPSKVFSMVGYIEVKRWDYGQEEAQQVIHVEV